VPGVHGSDRAKTAIVCAIGAVYTLAAAIELWRWEEEDLRTRKLAYALLGFHGVLYLARAADAAFAANDIGALWPQLVQSVMISEALLHSTGMAFVLLAMTRERAELRSTRSLIAARDAAVAASEARSRFLASMSHEVRTPLNAVIGLAQVLAEDEGFTSKQREQVETLEQAGRHLLSLVNDVLDLAKIDAGKFDLESRPFAVQSLATGCLSLLRATADARRISLELDIDPDVPRAVEGDETRMRQVLLNLLSNAVKFSPSDGRVAVRVQTRLAVLRLEIIDNGPGVPREKRDMLFQDYVQLDPVAAHRLGGSGLGLAISAALVRAMGGRIGWEAGPGGEGSLFWVEVPVRRSATEPPGLAAEGIRVTAPPVRAGRILVVDDMPSNRFLMSAMLERAGHSVQLASGGAEAIELLTRSEVDLVLMDVRMPEMSGFEAARRIRSIAGPVAQVPLLAVTADVLPEKIQACLDAGMNGYISKPVERMTLLAEIDRLLAGPAISRVEMSN
jgi:signal transduction histidine kinase/ActR/RegA family two-component response regulator